MNLRLASILPCLALSGCSLITVPVKTAGSIVTTTVKTAGDVVTAPFDAVSRRPASSKADEIETRKPPPPEQEAPPPPRRVYN